MIDGQFFDLPGSLSLDEFIARNHWDNTSNEEAGLFFRALHTAVFRHDGQTRNGGRIKYIEHLLVVADGLRRLGFGIIEQIAALLHDVVEDRHMTKRELIQYFGLMAAIIVWALSKSKKRKTPYFEQLYEATKIHHAVIFIKLLDRWHNLTTVWGLRNREKQLRVLQETVGPMRELFIRCRELIPEDRLEAYDVLVHKVISLAEGLLKGMTPSEG